jgi:hypothetical protein
MTVPIGEILNSIPKSVFVLYLIISTNFVANLFGCRVQYALMNNMWLKHLLGFMTMYFSVVLIDSKAEWSDSPQKQLVVALMFYTAFVFTTRMDYKWWFTFVIGLSVIYILQVHKEHPKSTEEERIRYNYYQQWMTYIVAIVGLIGFFVYMGRKRAEYGKKFDFLTFIVGKTTCRHNPERVKLTDLEAIAKGIGVSK